MIPIENETKRIDWNAIRAEYIAGGIGQRKLAKKYGVSPNTLIKRANAEKWTEQRDGVYNVATTAIQQKTAEAAADNATLAADIKHRLLERLKRIEAKYPLDATEVRRRNGNSTAIFRLRDLTAAYKDLTEDMPKSSAADIEDLTPLAELLRE